MTDKTPIERVRAMLDERGVEHHDNDLNADVRITKWDNGGKRPVRYEVWGNGTTRLDAGNVTPEQAVAATLGSERHPYEQRITGDGSNWGEIMRDAYDELMAAASESCTPEQLQRLTDYIRAELGSGKLTAEQVREVIEGHVTFYEGGDYDEQAIADELNRIRK